MRDLGIFCVTLGNEKTDLNGPSRLTCFIRYE